GATVSYTLSKGGKVVAEEKNLASLPSKGVAIAAADAAGPFELRVSADGGAVKVAQVGVTVTDGGKTRQWGCGGRPFDLDVKDAPGGTVRAITVGATPVAVEEPKKKTDDVPKKLPDEIKKKPDETKKKAEEIKKKDDETKKPAAPAPREK